VLAHDASCYLDFCSGEAGQQALAQGRPIVLPELRRQGVSHEQITAMLVDNPRRYFTPKEG
jgi:phosphotriesterase-related protein